MSLKLRSKRVAAVASVGILVSAGAAFGYWTTTGSGTGSATTGDSVAVSVVQSGTIDGLVPGSTAAPIDFTINNGSDNAQYVTSVAVSISSITKGGLPAADCGSGNFTLVQPTAIARDLPSGVSTFSPSGASIAMKNLATNQDGCKGVTVNLAYAAS